MFDGIPASVFVRATIVVATIPQFRKRCRSGRMEIGAAGLSLAASGLNRTQLVCLESPCQK